jgi:shikimate kinase
MKQVIILVGAMGCGKSFYCQEHLPNYTRISQDDQGKERHKELFSKALEKDDLIVVDRINHTRQQRANYLNLAKKSGFITKIIWFNVSKDVCLKRIKERKNHPTLQADKAEQALSWFFKEFQFPSKQEADEIELIGDKPPYAPVKDICSEIGDRRFLIVGDLHGVLEELKLLLEERQFNAQEDVLISCGDIVDRGPLIKETIDFLMGLPRFYSVMGNHDEKCLRYFNGAKVQVAHGLDLTIQAFNNSMPKVVLDFLENFPYILKTPAGYVVHAGFDPLMLPEEQHKRDCIYMRYYGGKNYFDNIGGILWYKLWPKEYPKVFFGHIPDPSGPNLPNVVSLDGGCVFGDYLKAYDSADGIVYYLNALKTYSTHDFNKE